MTEQLTDGGRAYAESQPDDRLIPTIALQADAGDTTWPEPFRNIAVRLCNEEGESE